MGFGSIVRSVARAVTRATSFFQNPLVSLGVTLFLALVQMNLMILNEVY